MDATADSGDSRSFQAVLARLLRWAGERYALPPSPAVVVVERPAGVDSQVLVVAVEYVTEPSPSGAHFLREEITVNLSGPERRQGIPEKRAPELS